MFDCFRFSFWSQLVSYQGGHQFVTVHTPGDFIVMCQWRTRLLAPCPTFPLGQIIPILS